MKKKVLIIDIFSHLHRAYHALPDLRTPDNMPTGAIYGVLKMLNHLREHYPADCGVCVFDSPGENFRHKIYKDYKANRGKPDDDFIIQIEPLIECIKANGWSYLRINGVEADDIIGTISTQFSQIGYRCLISTGDKDLAQLVDENIILINGEYVDIDIDGVYKKFGVWPHQIVDYLSLVGDTSDNIPGVYKVGPKTAQKWISQYESIDEIINQKDTFKGATGNNLRASIDQLKTNRQLITVLKDVDLDFDIGYFTFKEPDIGKLRDIYTELNFSSWLKKLPGYSQEHEVRFNAEYTDKEKDILFILVNKNKGEDWISLTYEGSGIDGLQKKEDVSTAELKSIVSGQKRIVTCSAKDLFHLINTDLHNESVVDDVSLISYVLASHKKHSLENLLESMQYENCSSDINTNHLRYVWRDLQKQLHNNHSQENLYTDIELPVQRCLFAMEKQGVLIDTEYLLEQGKTFDHQIKELTNSIYLLAGDRFNILSTLQLQEVLFDKLNLPVLKKTPKGAPSTDEEVLHQLAEHHEIAVNLITFRMLSKLKSTYVDGLLSKVHEKTSRIHTTYCQTTTVTGRLSSIEPNLQNIPIRNMEGKLIRKAFIAPEGHLLLSADYSQIELRLLAHLSQDKNLCQALHSNKDIHCATAAEVLGKDIKSVTDEERRWAKTINFGLMYGMSAFSLAKQLGIPQQNARFFIDRYFERYTQVAHFMSKIREFAHREGYVETIMGRRIWISDINSKNVHLKTAAERTAINGPMQGSAADLIKVAMVNLHNRLAETNLESTIIMQVHDELVLEVPEYELEKVSQLVHDTMESAIKLYVPLEVTISTGKNWESAH